MALKLERKHLYGNSNFRALKGNPESSERQPRSIKPPRRYPNTQNSLQDELQTQSVNIDYNGKRNSEFRKITKEYATYDAVNGDMTRINFLKNAKLVPMSSGESAGVDAEGRKASRRLSQNVTKTHLNKNADIESQYVSSANYKTKTDDQKFNIKKVLDFRSLIKRRYYFQNDFAKIFFAWTGNNRSKITTEDIERMSQKIGVPLNAKESQFLMQLASRRTSKYLDCKNFCDMIFKDGFFDYISKESDDTHSLPENELKEFISKKALEFGQIVLLNQIQTAVKKGRLQLTDKSSNFSELSKKEFATLVANQQSKQCETWIPESTQQSTILNAVFDQYKNPQQKVDIHDLLKVELQDEHKLLASSRINSSTQAKGQDIDYFLRKNKREVPFNKLESSFRNIVNVIL
jgi:hypothetical protein